MHPNGSKMKKLKRVNVQRLKMDSGRGNGSDSVRNIAPELRPRRTDAAAMRLQAGSNNVGIGTGTGSAGSDANA